MAIDSKFEVRHKDLLRDSRPLYARISEWLQQPDHSFVMFLFMAFSFHGWPPLLPWADSVLAIGLLYFFWLSTRDRTIAFKMPHGAKYRDGKGKDGKAEGILYLGNTDPYREEVWFTNSDARTHILYLGTTGSGKTEGLKSMATNAMSWSSGFVYIDGKADTDLWSSLSQLVRRFGRDDDLLVLNYMTGNSDRKAPSNTMNPFSSGSASYLTNMLVSLMPDAEGDNAMWKERAVSLLGSLIPALTWKRDNQDIPMSVGIIRQSLTLGSVVKMSRDENIPDTIRKGIKGYLETLPGFVDAAFDDEGRDKPGGPDQPMIDTTTAKTQHGYLSMQFTRSLQSLADDYGYIFDSQAADVDMVDVVLNRRVLIVLIPALEKSADETANLGKIVAATIKGMMGSTLGSTVEGESSAVIENKPTNSGTPFMVVFDEVGYYTAAGMAVMAAQARSLGFCLIFSAQDLPALEKRVKEEARSIAANCNIKIFGKLEDPTQTKEFFEKTVGTSYVTEVSGFSSTPGSMSRSYMDTNQAGIQLRGRSNYDSVRSFKEGQAVIAFGDRVVDVRIFYSNPGFAKAMRVTRYVALPLPDETQLKHVPSITKLRDLMVKKGWSAMRADVAVNKQAEIAAMADAMVLGGKQKASNLDCGLYGIAAIYGLSHPISLDEKPIDMSQIEEAADVKQPPGSPMNVRSAQPGRPVSFGELDQAKQPPARLDVDTKEILKEAARKARKSIFRSGDTKSDAADNPLSAQRGSAIVYVFIGIILFAALMFTFSRSTKNSSQSASPAQAKIQAQALIDYAEQVANAVNRMIANGVSENDLSFGNTVFGNLGGDLYGPYSKYPNCTNTACQVFSPAGGNVVARRPINDPVVDGPLATSNFYTLPGMLGVHIITIMGVGTPAPELVLTFHSLSKDVCAEINILLHNNFATNPPVGDDTKLEDDFVGSYTGSLGVLGDGDDPVLYGLTEQCHEFRSLPGFYIYQKVALVR